MKQFRIAQVGCGGVSSMHLDGYATGGERVRVVAACDPSAEAREAVRTKYNVPAVYPGIAEMIAGTDFDVAVVCTPTAIREAVVTELAKAGKHMLVEKPFADNLPEAERIVAICDRHNVQIAVDQNFRWHFPFDQARQLIQDGRIGNPLLVVHQDLMWRRDKGWRMELPRYALSVMGVHWFDGFRYMLGSEAATIRCITSTTGSATNGDTEASSLITFKNGTVVSYIESFTCTAWVVECRVIGDKGMIRLTYDAVELQPGGGAKLERFENPFGGPAKPKSAFMALNNLLTAIETGTEPANSGRDNLKTIELLEKAYASSQEKRELVI